MAALDRLRSGGVHCRGALAMISLLTALSILSLAVQNPETDSLRALARDGPDSALVERVRQRANDARKALRQLLAVGVAGDSVGAVALTAAERLAGAFAVAWGDSFFVHQVARVRSLAPAERQVTVTADSILRAGKAARRSAGIDAAMRAWRESLRRYDALADTSGSAAAFRALGAGFYYAQELDSAVAYLTRSQDLAQRIGDSLSVAMAVGNLGAVSEQRGELRRASELYARAKSIDERMGDVISWAIDQNNIGIVTAELGDWAGARRACEAALAASRSAGDSDRAALPLRNLGKLAEGEGHYAAAAAHWRDALSIYRERGNRLDATRVLYNLGELATRRADYPAAVLALSEAAGILGRTGPSGEVNELDVRVLLAQTRTLMGDLQSARTELQRAEAFARRRGEAGGRAYSLAKLALARGDLAQNFNRFAEAEQQYERAQRLARGAAADPFEVRNRAQIGMADVLFRRESYRHVRGVLEQLLLTSSVDLQNAAQIRVLIGQAAWRGGDTAAARQAFGQALDTMRVLGDVADEARALATLADLEASAGRALVAESLYRQGGVRLGTRPPPAISWQLHAGLASTPPRR